MLNEFIKNLDLFIVKESGELSKEGFFVRAGDDHITIKADCMENVNQIMEQIILHFTPSCKIGDNLICLKKIANNFYENQDNPMAIMHFVTY